MKKKLQVFVSSTYLDLREERQAAVEAILEAGHIPAGMELFAAADESQLETIRQWIDDSDVFMLILGGRYGSIEPKSEKSYIQLEYEYAVKQKKPHFAAIISDEFLDTKVKKVGASGVETANGKKLIEFKESVTKKICKFFGDLNQLKLIVFQSLGKFSSHEELSGWVRGSDVVDPKATLEQVNRLQTENAELKQHLAVLEARSRANIAAIGLEDSTAQVLSDDAKELLTAAAASGDRIMYLKHMGGVDVQAGKKKFVTDSDRAVARWKAAIDELHGNGFIEDIGSKGEIFRITKLGYEFSDEIVAEKEGKPANDSTPAPS